MAVDPLRAEVYKGERLDADVPRLGDFAEVRNDHGHALETGLLVRVVNDPHHAEASCAICGQTVVGWFVEVQSNHPSFAAVPGPHFYPLQWLKRFDPSRNRGLALGQ